MRVRVLALMIAGLLASAGAAAARVTNGIAVNAPPVQSTTNSPPGSYRSLPAGFTANEVASRQSRYLMRVETLREKLVQTQARDGGQLTSEHAASLQHELDKLNRIYGVKAG
jgi:hypothetical protein